MNTTINLGGSMATRTSRKKMHPKILIVDYGSQVSTLISRTLRDLGIRSILLRPKRAEWWMKSGHAPRGIILSGGDRSVYEEGAPGIPDVILTSPAPILGICYGMQLIVHKLGGRVENNPDMKEYGEALLQVEEGASHSLLMHELDDESIVWMSHGDSVVMPPPGFRTLALSTQGQQQPVNAIIERNDSNGYRAGVQFHPEVKQTEDGVTLLRNFVMDICRCTRDWRPQKTLEKVRVEITRSIGKDRAVLGYSGGVDSSLVAALAAPPLGKHLLGIVIDTGFLRQGELAEIRANAKSCGITIRVVRAESAFECILHGHTDAETKRKAFQILYRDILQREAVRFGAQWIIQGTLATDLIESAAKAGAAHIKSHHNVGLKFQGLKQLHPLRSLFKYEVRELAAQCGLPTRISQRPPFPGPGLSIRIVGLHANRATAERIRAADALVRSIFDEHHLSQHISQPVIALVGAKTTGVKGDGRVYGDSIVVRPVVSEDFMTCEGYIPPPDVMRQITRELTRLPNIVRCWWDFTEKPPATTELE